ncbi:MAG: hypothetical protein PUG24_03920, partial [Eubacteriales bacterium]|nr:hypothetical protein [Eubacteriales bacterium]
MDRLFYKAARLLRGGCRCIMSTQETIMPKGKYYLKGRYTNMKKFLAIFMVVAVVMGMTFIVM